MRLSLFHPYQLRRPAELLATAALAERVGAYRVWCGASQGFDSLLAVTLLALRFPRLRFGLSVALAPFKHPVQAGIEARSMAALSPDFVYGIGVGDAELRRVLGAPAGGAARYARDYLTTARSAGGTGLGLGALRAGMAEVAGECADACITWLAPPAYLEQVTVPSVRAGAERAGRTAPPIVALLPYLGDAPVERGRELLRHHLSSPTYRAIPAALGLDEPAFVEQVAIREPLQEPLAALRAAGADEVALAVYRDVGELPAGALARLGDVMPGLRS